MKRKDLKVGMLVYPRAEWRGGAMVVMATEPYEETGGGGNRRYRPAVRGVGTHVAVAKIKHRYGQSDAPPEWEPAVVNLSQLISQEGYEARVAHQAAERARSIRLANERAAKKEERRLRLRALSGHDITVHADGDVSITADRLIEILEYVRGQ